MPVDTIRAAALRVVGATLVLADLVAVAGGYDLYTRLALCSGGLLLLTSLNWTRSSSLGFRLRLPDLAWREWLFVLSVPVVLVVFRFVVSEVADELFIVGFPPRIVKRLWFQSIVLAPLIEETVCRVFVSGASLATARRSWRIGASSAAFVALHALYGSIALEHIAWAVVGAWLFVRTGLAWVTIALHALGNTVSLLAPLAMWFACGGREFC